MSVEGGKTSFLFNTWNVSLLQESSMYIHPDCFSPSPFRATFLQIGYKCKAWRAVCAWEGPIKMAPLSH